MYEIPRGGDGNAPPPTIKVYVCPSCGAVLRHEYGTRGTGGPPTDWVYTHRHGGFDSGAIAATYALDEGAHLHTRRRSPMYEIRTTLSRYWSESSGGFPAQENNLMGWTVAANASVQTPLSPQQGRSAVRSAARHALDAGRTVTVYINPAHLVEVVPLG